MKFLDLNVDCLLKILNYCSESDLLNLCQTHLILHNVIEAKIFHMQSLDLVMCGHRNSPVILKRTKFPLTNANRLKIANNWINGCYREQGYFNRSKLFAMKLILEKDWLYLTNLCYLNQYKRLKSEPLQHRNFHEIATKDKTDIADFAKDANTIFAGRVAGNCFVYEENYVITEQQLHSTSDYLRSVTFHGNVFVTSSEQCCKLWRKTFDLGLLYLDFVRKINNSYKTVQFSFCGQRLYGGMYRSVNKNALHEYDIESGIMRVLNSETKSIYDLKIKDDNIIYTANFDTTFRLYDRRTDKDELIWEDPFDSSFYCLDHDGLHAVLCGTKYHSRVNLYDIRVPNRYIQLYFPRVQLKHGKLKKSSPVYSLCCDSRFLFIATAHNLQVLDFKVEFAKVKDYRNLFHET